MFKSLFVILVSFGVSMTVGKNVCSQYEDEACILPSSTKESFYVNQWSVHMPEVPKEEARRILEEELGFVYLGQIMNGIDLHLVTKENTFEKHAMPNKKIIATLMKNSNVQSVAQKHVIQNSPDEVFSVLDVDKVECLSIDPDTIQLNDGRENLERIQIGKDIEASTVKIMARPISSQNESDGDEDEDEDYDSDESEQKDKPLTVNNGPAISENVVST